MKLRIIVVMAVALFITVTPTVAQEAVDAEALKHSVSELRQSVGRWAVTTQFLNADGTTAKEVNGSYEFSWVVQDRVISGKAETPELQQVSAILFYIHEAKNEIALASVGSDGKLWVMTGTLGQDVRTSKEFTTSSGKQGQLKLTRYNVTQNSFESKMDYTEDGGNSWLPGNHQLFRREASGH